MRRCNTAGTPPPAHPASQPAPTRHPPMLTAAHLDHWHRRGWLALPRLRSAQAVAALKQRAHEIVDAFEPGERPAVFSTVDPGRLRDQALIDSAEAVQCFFEEEAHDAQGRLRVPKALSINKIGHALHVLDPVAAGFSRGPDLAQLALALGLREPQLRQSMLIFKQPGIGGEVRWHQDATYFVTDPISVTTFWFALEDATQANGCLWVQDGGHRSPLRERFVREGQRLRLETLDPTPWPGAGDARPVEVEAGTLVLMHGLLPHCSAPNRSAHSRLAYTLHVTDGRSAWSAANWLQARRLPLLGFE